MKTYDLTVMLPKGSTAAKKKGVKTQIEKLIKIQKGKIKKTDDWGEIGLTQKIEGNESGVFFDFQLELKGEVLADFRAKLDLEKDILRYLLVKTNDK